VPLRTEGGQCRYDLAAIKPGFHHAMQVVRTTVAYASGLAMIKKKTSRARSRCWSCTALARAGVSSSSPISTPVTVFSTRLYGSRSHKNRKLIDGVRAAVREAQC
jgi:hypothetical protein